MRSQDKDLRSLKLDSLDRIFLALCMMGLGLLYLHWINIEINIWDESIFVLILKYLDKGFKIGKDIQEVEWGIGIYYIALAALKPFGYTIMSARFFHLFFRMLNLYLLLRLGKAMGLKRRSRYILLVLIGLFPEPIYYAEYQALTFIGCILLIRYALKQDKPSSIILGCYHGIALVIWWKLGIQMVSITLIYLLFSGLLPRLDGRHFTSSRYLKPLIICTIISVLIPLALNATAKFKSYQELAPAFMSRESMRSDGVGGIKHYSQVMAEIFLRVILPFRSPYRPHTSIDNIHQYIRSHFDIILMQLISLFALILMGYLTLLKNRRVDGGVLDQVDYAFFAMLIGNLLRFLHQADRIHSIQTLPFLLLGAIYLLHRISSENVVLGISLPLFIIFCMLFSTPEVRAEYNHLWLTAQKYRPLVIQNETFWLNEQHYWEYRQIMDIVSRLTEPGDEILAIPDIPGIYYITDRNYASWFWDLEIPLMMPEFLSYRFFGEIYQEDYDIIIQREPYANELHLWENHPLLIKLKEHIEDNFILMEKVGDYRIYLRS